MELDEFIKVKKLNNIDKMMNITEHLSKLYDSFIGNTMDDAIQVFINIYSSYHTWFCSETGKIFIYESQWKYYSNIKKFIEYVLDNKDNIDSKEYELISKYKSNLSYLNQLILKIKVLGKYGDYKFIFDVNKDIIQFKNGLYDIITKSYRNYSYDDYVMTYLNYSYIKWNDVSIENKNIVINYLKSFELTGSSMRTFSNQIYDIITTNKTIQPKLHIWVYTDINSLHFYNSILIMLGFYVKNITEYDTLLEHEIYSINEYKYKIYHFGNMNTETKLNNYLKQIKSILKPRTIYTKSRHDSIYYIDNMNQNVIITTTNTNLISVIKKDIELQSKCDMIKVNHYEKHPYNINSYDPYIHSKYLISFILNSKAY